MSVDEKIINFLSPGDSSLFIYIHRTPSEQLANKIMQEGFEFYDSLHNTTDVIINDPIHIQYWLKIREHYGNYTIVISLKKTVFFKYLELIKKNPNYPKIHVEVEQILTEKTPYVNANDDKIFTLSKHFIKGYFNNTTKETVYNPEYDPLFDSPVFEKNLTTIIAEQSALNANE
ncbi:MAG: hypothetical protein GXO79_05325 [Chlorobi bacterium]|nr:hypothetical protein [Chlorobiota bacterium]